MTFAFKRGGYFTEKAYSIILDRYSSLNTFYHYSESSPLNMFKIAILISVDSLNPINVSTTCLKNMLKLSI